MTCARQNSDVFIYCRRAALCALPRWPSNPRLQALIGVIQAPTVRNIGATLEGFRACKTGEHSPIDIVDPKKPNSRPSILITNFLR